jgi:hypothetical protein
MRPKNKHSGETPPTFLQKNEFLEIPYCYKKYQIANVLTVFLQIRRRNACINGSRASRLHAVVLNRW